MGVAEHAIRLAGKFGEDGIFLWCQMDLDIVAKDAAVIEVDPYRAGFDHADLVPVRCGALMPQRGADAGEQFVGVERLGDIVVGAEIERDRKSTRLNSSH